MSKLKNVQEIIPKTDQDVYESIKENNNYTISDIAFILAKSEKTIIDQLKS